MTKEEMREIVQEAVRSEIGQLYIDRESHYLDHAFVKDIRDSADKIRGAACKATTYGLLTMAGGFILWAFRHWLAETFGGK